jgi:hypothetical protein
MRKIVTTGFAAGIGILILIGCKAELAASSDKVSHGTRLVLLESGIHWAEWIKADNTPCGDVYKWDNAWIADTYNEGGLEQHPFDTKEQAIAYVQKWCQ